MEQKTFIFSTVPILHMHICINKYMYTYMYICLYLYMLIFQYNEDNSYRKDFLIGELIHSNPDSRADIPIKNLLNCRRVRSCVSNLHYYSINLLREPKFLYALWQAGRKGGRGLIYTSDTITAEATLQFYYTPFRKSAHKRMEAQTRT